MAKLSSQKIIIVAGPSGSGKSTVCKYLLDHYPQKIVLSVSETTRAPRNTERAGEHYVYISAHAFQKRAERFHYYEWFYVHGNYYGTPRYTLERMFEQGRVPLLDIDVNGKKRIARLFPQHLSIFVSPVNLEQLRLRLLGRSTDSVEEINRRLDVARAELKEATHFHHVIVNDKLEDTLKITDKVVMEYLNE